MALSAILVCTDFSPLADRALDVALDLAARVGAKVTVLHVWDLPAFSLPPGYLVPTEDVVGAVRGAAQGRLKALLEEHARAGVAVRGELREGVPWEQVDAVARETSADLVVVGTHGRRGLGRALLGSVAEKVLRTSNRPVLVVPPG